MTIKRTYVHIILDESGSMQPVQRETVDGLNEHIQTIKAHAGETGDTKVTFVRFNSSILIVYAFRNVDQLVPLSYDQYQPNQNTRLFDAVGETVQRAMTEERRLLDAGEDLSDTAHLVLVVSDGQENSSRHYNGARIASMVKDAQDTGRFTFAYLGANQDLAEVKRHLGEAMQTKAWASTARGTKAAWVSSADSHAAFASMRMSGRTAVPDFWAEGNTAPAQSGQQTSAVPLDAANAGSTISTFLGKRSRSARRG